MPYYFADKEDLERYKAQLKDDAAYLAHIADQLVFVDDGLTGRNLHAVTVLGVMLTSSAGYRLDNEIAVLNEGVHDKELV